ncbi:enoyl- hydratase [Trichoderma cornu-damae]|uniref:Enoyl- hydratase n=1 Tax=Trichoderma cornu-damae TaxID=654480 RepID=A0A9P8TYL2_9HYPO|nr:enoyl- hydratase [Trichoderma cornu-damae]
MAPPEPPSSYNTFTLPTLQFSHHPASSPSVTPVVVIKLHRPSARNAFTQEMAESLIKAYALLSADARVRAVVLTSSDAENNIFCAGMDFNDRGESSPSADEHRDEGGQVSLALFRCTKPVVVAINGSAVGIGITMTLPANIRVASKDAKIGFVFSQRGFCLEACSSFFLPRLIGTSKALHLATTGSVYPASHKLLDGLFTELVDADQVLPTALRIADEIAANVSLASATVMKNQIYRAPASPEEAHLVESKLFYSLVRSKDAQEGIQSFLQKRKPAFKDTIENDAPPGYPWWAPVDVRSRSKL